MLKIPDLNTVCPNVDDYDSEYEIPKCKAFEKPSCYPKFDGRDVPKCGYEVPKCVPAPACGAFEVPKCNFKGTVCDTFYEPISELEEPKKCDSKKKKSKKCKKSKDIEEEPRITEVKPTA